jgi:hypothetical protein
MMIMNMEQLVERDLAGETEVLEENVHYYHFVLHKSHVRWNPGEKPAINRLGNGMSFLTDSQRKLVMKLQEFGGNLIVELKLCSRITVS